MSISTVVRPPKSDTIEFLAPLLDELDGDIGPALILGLDGAPLLVLEIRGAPPTCRARVPQSVRSSRAVVLGYPRPTIGPY